MNAEDSSIDDLLVRQVLGEALAPHEQARLDAALAHDAALRAEADSLARTMQRVAGSFAVTPPPALRERVLAATAAATAAKTVPAAASATAATRWGSRWPEAMAASVAVLAVAGATSLWIQNQQLRRDAELHDTAARMLLEPNVVKSFTITGTGSDTAAQGVVLLDLDAKRASISVRSLPALPAGKSYFLWAELADKRVPCGHFNPMEDGTLLTQFQIPVDSYTSPIARLVMTIEDDANPTAASGPVVMSSS